MWKCSNIKHQPDTPLAANGNHYRPSMPSTMRSQSSLPVLLLGMVNSANECILYSVSAASIPTQSSTNHDKACTSVPDIVFTTQNPTGASHKLAIRETCAAVPSASASKAPLSQSTGIMTAQACQAQCDVTSACESFVVGLISSVDECMLNSIAAADIPTQTSTNPVAYDKACASIPTQIPYTANATRADTGFSSSSSSSTSGSTTCSSSSTGSTTGSTSSTGSNTGSTAQNGEPSKRATNTCAATPTGPTGTTAAAPIQTPANVETVAACLADTSCESFEFGQITASGTEVCRLFSVAAPTSGQTFVVYDVGCSV